MLRPPPPDARAPAKHTSRRRPGRSSAATRQQQAGRPSVSLAPARVADVRRARLQLRPGRLPERTPREYRCAFRHKVSRVGVGDHVPALGPVLPFSLTF
jgi:hypothetical protein